MESDWLNHKQKIVLLMVPEHGLWGKGAGPCVRRRNCPPLRPQQEADLSGTRMHACGSLPAHSEAGRE